MNRSKLASLADNCTDPFLKQLYKGLFERLPQVTIAGDSESYSQFSSKDIDWLQDQLQQETMARYIQQFGQVETMHEARESIKVKMLGDNIVNTKTGIGTMLDPVMYTHSSVPVMCGPAEVSALYANGGLPAIIVDKKSRAMVVQGATFKPYNKDFWTTDKIEMLEDAAATTGFNDTVGDASCDSFLYGGAVLYPVFKRDSLASYLRPLDKLNLEKGCIDRWVHTDRWNTCIVPSYIVTAKDYLLPDTLMIPQSSLEISTTRMSLIKPRPVPYWVALYNIGWCPSDLAGWIRAYYGYDITCSSVPVMAQQMSLVLYKMPLDALNATIGPDRVKQLMEINEEKMSEWSALSPKAVNMVGDVEVVDRTYSGFDQFIGVMKSNLASQCGIPEPTLWHTPNKGFADNTQESLLKQSETLQMNQKFLERAMIPCTDALVAHCFGQDSEEWKNRHSVRMTFNKPVISTEKDLAEVGARYAASISSMSQAGVSPDIALSIAGQFFPTVKISQEMVNSVKESYEKSLETGLPSNQGGAGHSLASAGNKGTTGSFTKAK